MNQMGRNKQLVKNTSYVVIGNIGGNLISFLMLPLYTKWLSPADYGITDIISTYSSLLLFVVSFSLTDAMFVFPVGQTKDNITKYFTTGIYFIAFSCLLCAGVFFGVSKLNIDNSFINNIWLIYLTLISSIILRYSQDFCRGIKMMSVFSYTGIIQAFSVAAFSFLLIPKYGVIGYVNATVMASLCSAAFSFFYSKSYQYLSIRAFSMPFLKDMLKYSIPLIPTSVMWWLVSSLNRPLMEKYVGVFAIGLFAVANKLPTILNLVFGFFQKAWQVTVLDEFRSEDFRRYYNKMFKVIFSAQILVALLITAFSRLFITVMTDEEYFSAWKYIPLLTLSVLFSNTSAFCGTVFSASRKTQYTLYSSAIGGIIAVAANIILIPLIGIWGACLSITLSHFSAMVARIFFSSPIVHFDNTKYVVMQIGIFSLALMGMCFCNQMFAIISVAITMILYFITNQDILMDFKMIIKQRINCKK